MLPEQTHQARSILFSASAQTHHHLLGACPDTHQSAGASGPGAGHGSTSAATASPTVILKPEYGTQGTGIHIARSAAEFDAAVAACGAKKMVAQRYIERPLLLDGFKFDLRLYLVVVSVFPKVRAELYHEGLARFCTSPWRGAALPTRVQTQ